MQRSVDRAVGPQARVGATLRWSRAALLAGVALGTGVIAHASAGGLLPSVGTLLVLLTLTTVAAAGVLGRPASALRTIVLTVVGQTVVHALLTATAGHRGDHAATTATTPGSTTPAHVPDPVAAPQLATVDGRRVGSLMDAWDTGFATAATGHDPGLALPAPVVHVLADMTGAHAPMMLVHLVAAAVVGAWLAVGEHALWTLLALTATAVARIVAPLVVALAALAGSRPAPHTAAALRRGRPADDPPPLVGRLLVSDVVRRGPPRAYAGLVAA